MQNFTKSQKKQLKNQFKCKEISENRLKMCLSFSQLLDLMVFLDGQLSNSACDHSFHHMKQWAHIKNVDWQKISLSFEEFGIFCDCEILFNIDPENFIPLSDQEKEISISDTNCYSILK